MTHFSAFADYSRVAIQDKEDAMGELVKITRWRRCLLEAHFSYSGS